MQDQYKSKDELLREIARLRKKLGKEADAPAGKDRRAPAREDDDPYQVIFQMDPNPIMVVDALTRRFVNVNEAGCRLYEFTKEEFLRRTPLDISAEPEKTRATLIEAEAGRTHTPLRYHRKKDGTVFPVEVTTHAFRLRGRMMILLLMRDLTEQKRIQSQLHFTALHDRLTRMPNRALFKDRLARAMKQQERGLSLGYTVLAVALDRFRTVNESLGHAAGDTVLVAVGARLQAALGPDDTVARLGGDEFAILLEANADVRAGENLAKRIRIALNAPVKAAQQEVFVAASIGVAPGGPQYHSADEVLRDAELALVRAKKQGGGRYEIFAPEMRDGAGGGMEMEGELRQAIMRQEFQLHYQPIVNLNTNRIAAFEALVRWQHPRRGLVPPSVFIPHAEETGLIVHIGTWVLHEACRQMHAWVERFGPRAPEAVSVNVSGKHFAHPDLTGQVQRILAETGLGAERLKLEITEGVLMSDATYTVEVLDRLRELGVQILIDDFGTGYSSLNYLTRFPLDALKIDQSFVRHMFLGAQNMEVVRTITALARNLKLDVIAEGIEDADQLEKLKSMECSHGQGYYFARPEGFGQATALIERMNPAGGRDAGLGEG